MHETLVIIPARGGSKGIIDKNIVEVGAIPLIAYSIRTALNAKNRTRVVVTTDSEVIADVARSFGAETPFLRPPELAKDDTPLQAVTNHCIETLRKQEYEAPIHCIMLPPHMFRQPRLIDQSIDLLMQGWHRVYSVRRINIHDEHYFTMDKNSFLTPIQAKQSAFKIPAQHYRGYGNIAIFAPGLPTVGSKTIEISNPIEFIDIDTYGDLALAQEVVRQNLYDFEIA